MPDQDTYLDISELFARPLRTGIQRVERELIRHWPGPGRLVLCVYDHALDDLRVLPQAASGILTAASDAVLLDTAEECAALHALVAGQDPVRLPASARRLVNPELFFDVRRARFYERLAGSQIEVFWLVYDFLPYLEPRWFEQGSSRTAMFYLRALRSIRHVAFISEHTRQDYLRRAMRSTERDGPVIALGGDGLGLDAQRFFAGRAGYVVLGSIEPRKRVAAILEAFIALWAEGIAAPLTVIGCLLPHAQQEVQLMATLESQPLFRHLGHASDTAIREVIAGVRAMIFASEGEGFGLPPFESLYNGVPVVVSASVPSIEMLPARGQVRLERVSGPCIADAVRGLEDDIVAERLWREAADLRIPSWRDFAAAMAQWVHGP
ncbi:MAG: glycosyltransferase [Janthinobacterium lividum]